jgi:ribosomal protein S10
MKIILVFMLCCVFGMSQIVRAEESVEAKEQTEQEIKDMVEEIVETEQEIEVMAEKPVELPKEYDIPEDVIARLLNVQKAMNRADFQVRQRKNELDLASKSLALAKLEKQRLTELLSAEFRLFLTSKGVPYDDLPRWQLQNNRAVRTENSK